MANSINIENNGSFNNSIQENIQNIQNIQNISGIPKNMKITSWILFFISIIFSILLI
jgi:hypothetical protein